MKHFGDITKINGLDVPVVDVVTGGSPCQDLSVAGKRAGLAGERSGLFMEQIRVIKELREHDFRQRSNTGANVDFRLLRPRYMVWENVPGAFSSNGGEDFRAVLEETARVADKDATIPRPENGKWSNAGCIVGDGWSIAWRLHDAQFWGVPQRRKRISLVADFGGESAAEILFERKSLSRDIEESGEQGQGITADAQGGIDSSSYTLKIRGGCEFDRYGKRAGKGALIQEELSATLRVSQDQTLITHAHPSKNQSVVYGMSGYDSNSMKSSNPHSGFYEADTSRCLDENGGSPNCNQGGMMVVSCERKQQSLAIGIDSAGTIGADDYKEPQVVCIEGNGSRPSHKGDGYKESDVQYTLNSTEQHAVAYRKQGHAHSPEEGQGWQETETNDTLNAFDGGEKRTPTLVLENHPADSRVKVCEDGVFQTLSSRMGTGGGNVPMVMDNKKPVASFYPQMKAESQCYQEDDVSNTLVNGTNPGYQNAVCYGLDRASFNQGANAKFNFSIEEEKIGAQVAKGPGAICTAVDVRNSCEAEINGSLQSMASNNLNSNNVCRQESVVRRLTPLECTRLQGFPDGWVDIGDWTDSKGKLHKEADSVKYKALGNSIALPFWQWMAERMVGVLRDSGVERPTMASLFDGIGGFPLVYSRCGCVPVWASEVEDFCIAVTKRRFPEEDNE